MRVATTWCLLPRSIRHSHSRVHYLVERVSMSTSDEHHLSRCARPLVVVSRGRIAGGCSESCVPHQRKSLSRTGPLAFGTMHSKLVLMVGVSVAPRVRSLVNDDTTKKFSLPKSWTHETMTAERIELLDSIMLENDRRPGRGEESRLRHVFHIFTRFLANIGTSVRRLVAVIESFVPRMRMRGCQNAPPTLTIEVG